MPLRSDPRRLPRRNHYQEGPGFLFLAFGGSEIQQRYAHLSQTEDGRQLLGLKAPAQENLEEEFKRCRQNGVVWFRRCSVPRGGRRS